VEEQRACSDVCLSTYPHTPRGNKSAGDCICRLRKMSQFVTGYCGGSVPLRPAGASGLGYIGMAATPSCKNLLLLSGEEQVTL
jgi:hypothetical protein